MFTTHDLRHTFNTRLIYTAMSSKSYTPASFDDLHESMALDLQELFWTGVQVGKLFGMSWGCLVQNSFGAHFVSPTYHFKIYPCRLKWILQLCNYVQRVLEGRVTGHMSGSVLAFALGFKSPEFATCVPK